MLGFPIGILPFLYISMGFTSSKEYSRRIENDHQRSIRLGGVGVLGDPVSISGKREGRHLAHLKPLDTIEGEP